MNREKDLGESGTSLRCVGFAAGVRRLCGGRGKGLQLMGQNLAADAANLSLFCSFVMMSSERYRVLECKGTKF